MMREVKLEQLATLSPKEIDKIIECPQCGRMYILDELTDEEENDLFLWSERKMLIQNALPNRTPTERELIRYALTGLPMISCCDECYKENWIFDE